jgi:DNA repair exonuclease SbcCD ATPase subunit
MWSLLDDDSFPPLVVQVLRATTRYDWLTSHEAPLVIKRKRRKVAALAAPGFDHGDSARGALAILEHVDQRHRRALKENTDLRTETEGLRTRNAELADRSRRSQTLASELQRRLDDAQSQIALLREEITAQHHHATDKYAALSTDRLSDLARIRARFSNAIANEVEELRLYLDRPQPNVTDALLRLQTLESLGVELGAADGE